MGRKPCLLFKTLKYFASSILQGIMIRWIFIGQPSKKLPLICVRTKNMQVKPTIFPVILGVSTQFSLLIRPSMALSSRQEALFRCNTLLALDLSWNAFGDEVFGAIGAYVSQPHVHLRSLSLSNCSSAGTEGTDQDRQSEQVGSLGVLMCPDSSVFFIQVQTSP